MTDSRDDLEIIGWHDGITEAFVRTHEGRWLYASMIAWSPEQRLRIFGLVDADSAFVEDIRTLYRSADPAHRGAEQRWTKLRARIAAFLQDITGIAELRLCDQLDGEVKATLAVQAEEVTPLLGHDIEDTLDPTEFEAWFRRFGNGQEKS